MVNLPSTLHLGGTKVHYFHAGCYWDTHYLHNYECVHIIEIIKFQLLYFAE